MDVYHFYVSITWMSMNIWVASSFSFTEYACKSLKRKKKTRQIIQWKYKTWSQNHGFRMSWPLESPQKNTFCLQTLSSLYQWVHMSETSCNGLTLKHYSTSSDEATWQKLHNTSVRVPAAAWIVKAAIEICFFTSAQAKWGSALFSISNMAS